MDDFVSVIHHALLVGGHSANVDDNGRAHINTAYVGIHFMYLHAQNVTVDTREQAATALGAALEAVQMRTDSKQIKEWYQSLWKVREEPSDSKASVRYLYSLPHTHTSTQVYTNTHTHTQHSLTHSLTHGGCGPHAGGVEGFEDESGAPSAWLAAAAEYV